MPSIQTVDTMFIHQTWPLVYDYIKDSEKQGMSSPDYTAEQILVYLASGQWVLVVAVDEEGTIHGAMTLSFLNYPNNRVAFVTATGGKMIVNKDSLNQLEAIAKHYGATKIQAMARPSMERLLQTCGFESGNKLMELKI